MAQDHSFDITSKPSIQEIDNAIQMAMKEILNRFDFKGSVSKIEKEAENIKIISDDEFKLKNVIDVFQNKLVKRGVSLKFFEYGKIEQALGAAVKQLVVIKQGIPQEKAKEINKFIKELGRKVQTQIQGDQIRVSAKKIDDLQSAIQGLKTKDFGIVLQFVNYR